MKPTKVTDLDGLYKLEADNPPLTGAKMAVSKTIMVAVPNPRDKKQFDHYLFWFAHRGGDNEYVCAAIPCGEDPSDACREWAYNHFPHSACDEGRYHWKRVIIRSRKEAIPTFSRAAKAKNRAVERYNIARALLDPRVV